LWGEDIFTGDKPVTEHGSSTQAHFPKAAILALRARAVCSRAGLLTLSA
jgi:hypothetical protein